MMKTPREILFERHRASEPALDEIRKRALSEALGASAGQVAAENGHLRGPATGGALANFWREVIWRSRLAWIGMAACWVLLWMVNRQLDPVSTTVVSARSRPTAETVRAFEEQQRLLAELLQPAAPAPAEPARPRPQPRSELRTTLRAC
jgi:hypothetical protein